MFDSIMPNTKTREQIKGEQLRESSKEEMTGEL